MPSRPSGGRPWTCSRDSDQTICPVDASQSHVHILPASKASLSRSFSVRSESRARFCSSMSVHVPYHLTMRSFSLQSGIARVRNQR